MDTKIASPPSALKLMVLRRHDMTDCLKSIGRRRLGGFKTLRVGFSSGNNKINNSTNIKIKGVNNGNLDFTSWRIA